MANETEDGTRARLDLDSVAETDRVILARLAGIRAGAESIREEVRRIAAYTPSIEGANESVDQLIDRVDTILRRQGSK